MRNGRLTALGWLAVLVVLLVGILLLARRPAGQAREPGSEYVACARLTLRIKEATVGTIGSNVRTTDAPEGTRFLVIALRNLPFDPTYLQPGDVQIIAEKGDAEFQVELVVVGDVTPSGAETRRHTVLVAGGPQDAGARFTLRAPQMEPVTFTAEGSPSRWYRSGIDLGEFGREWGEGVEGEKQGE